MRCVTTDRGFCDDCGERGVVHVHPATVPFSTDARWCTACEARHMDDAAPLVTHLLWALIVLPLVASCAWLYAWFFS